MTDAQKQRTGFVALCGRPNAGKSTLLNAILGQEIALVSPKPQTTRNRIIGVHNLPGAQLVLVDTPGLAEGRRELEKRMARGAREAAGDADVVVWVVDAARLRGGRRPGGDDLRPPASGLVVALNKVDLIKPKNLLLPMIQQLSELDEVDVVVPLSALRDDGVSLVVDEVAARLPEGPALYPPEMITDRSERFLAAELVRGAVLRYARDEIPHATAVEVTAWRESPKGVHVEAAIYVERESQKAILIGKGGEMIKRIGAAARGHIGRALDCEVHLSLRVDVSSQWRTDPAMLARLGYDE